MTRKQLEELGYNEEQVNQLVSLHGEGIEKIKRERDDAQSKIVELETTLTEREQEVNELKDNVDNSEELKTKLEEITTNYDTYKQEAEEREKQFKFDSALNLHLVKSGTLDVKSLQPHIDLSTLELQEDGTLKGFNEQIETLREEKKFLFGESLDTGLEHGKPLPKEPTLKDTLWGKE